jgi:hypothetical protein
MSLAEAAEIAEVFCFHSAPSALSGRGGVWGNENVSGGSCRNRGSVLFSFSAFSAFWERRCSVKWKCLSRKLQKSRKCFVFFLRLQRFLREAVFGEMEMSLAEAAEIAEMFCFLSAPSALSGRGGVW